MEIIVTIKDEEREDFAFGIKDVEQKPLLDFFLLMAALKRIVVSKILERIDHKVQ